MKLTSKPLGILILIILFGSVLWTSLTNLWQTSSTKEPVKFATGEAAGQYNPADIRGSYSFGDINKSFKVPVADLKTAFGIAENVDGSTFQVKSLEGMYTGVLDGGVEMGTGSVRYFVALYAGLPFTVTEETYLFKPAVEILKTKALKPLTPEQIKYLDAHIVALPTAKATAQPGTAVQATTKPEATIQATPQPETTAQATPQPTNAQTVAATDKTIKGKTTFKDLMDWGVSKETIEKIIGGTIPIQAMLIKDYATQKSLDFETIKVALQAEVDKKK